MIFNRIFLVGVFLFCFANSFAQTVTFEKTVDTLGFYYANSVKQTLDGGYVFCGSSYSLSTAQDAEIAKIDSLGNFQWVKKYGTPATDGAITVEVTNDSNYFVFGIENNTTVNQSDVWILKLDHNGDTIFTKKIELGIGMNVVRASTKTLDGGYALTGNTNTRGYGLSDVSLIKLNAQGDTTWIRTYGGTDSEYGQSIFQTSDSGFAIVGSTGSFNVQLGDMYIIRTDKNGDTLWTRTFGFTYGDFGNSIVQTLDGGFAVAGTSWDSITGHYDIYLLKYDSNGTLLWNKRMMRNKESSSTDIKELFDGRLLISGTAYNSPPNYDAFLLETNDNGDTLWSKSIGYPSGNEQSYNLALTSDGGMIICGSTDVNNIGQTYVVKLDSIGSFSNSVNELGHTELLDVFPNPVSSILHINVNSSFSKLEFKLFDFSGKEVEVNNRLIDSSEIDMSKFSNGIYFLCIYSEKKLLRYNKIILTH